MENKLIPMTTFVAEQWLNKLTTKQQLDNIYNYSLFLKQQLEIGFFIPCENNVPLEKPLNYDIWEELEYNDGKGKEALLSFLKQNHWPEYYDVAEKQLPVRNDLIIEWLDSVYLFIEVYTTWESYNKVKQFSFKIIDENDKVLCDKWLSPYFNSRQEATEAAIKKAVEIYNSKYGNPQENQEVQI